MEDRGGIGTGGAVKKERRRRTEALANAHGMPVVEYKRWLSALRRVAREAKYYAKNRERILAYQIQYYAKNKELIREKAYYKQKTEREYEKLRQQKRKQNEEIRKLGIGRERQVVGF